MKIHPAEQGSAQWLHARAGVATASEWDALLTPEFKVRTGEMPKTYLALKVAEAWFGGPMPKFNAFAMEQGNILEDEAKPWYELETGQKIQNVGLCTTDDGRLGCSPDGLLGDDSGIEIKCPEMPTHVKYLLAGDLPKDYAVQVHGSMFVTGRKSWRFLSYRRHFPAFLITVERDDRIQEAIKGALAGFLDLFDEAMAKMIVINGAPPIKRPPPEPMVFSTAYRSQTPS